MIVLRPLPLVEHFAEEALESSPINYQKIREAILANNQKHAALLARFEADRQAVITEFMKVLKPKLPGVIKRVSEAKQPITPQNRRFIPELAESYSEMLQIAEAELLLLLSGEANHPGIITRYDPDQLTELDFYILQTLYFRLGGVLRPELMIV